MKAPSARVAMLLSIGGVLAAGSAAALVNSQVLDDQSGGAPASATAVSTTIPVDSTTTASAVTVAAPTVITEPSTTVTTAPPTSASAPSTAAPTSTTAPTTAASATAPTVAGSQATYRLGDAGTALLDTAGGQLAIVAVTPLPGWSVEHAENDGAGVEIRLESTDGEVRFEASLVRGVVRVSLESDDDNSGSGSGDDDNSGPGGGGDDDNSGPGGGGDDDNSGPGGGDDD